jgi:hypothetical protein
MRFSSEILEIILSSIKVLNEAILTLACSKPHIKSSRREALAPINKTPTQLNLTQKNRSEIFVNIFLFFSELFF